MSGIPSQSQIDNAREALERAQMKLGRVQARSILSGAQARADLNELSKAQAIRDKAESDYVEIVARFTQTDTIAEATQAIRDRLQPAADQDTARPAPLLAVVATPSPAAAQDPAEAMRSLGDLLRGVERETFVAAPPAEGA